MKNKILMIICCSSFLMHAMHQSAYKPEAYKPVESVGVVGKANQYWSNFTNYWSPAKTQSMQRVVESSDITAKPEQGTQQENSSGSFEFRSESRSNAEPVQSVLDSIARFIESLRTGGSKFIAASADQVASMINYLQKIILGGGPLAPNAQQELDAINQITGKTPDHLTPPPADAGMLRTDAKIIQMNKVTDYQLERLREMKQSASGESTQVTSQPEIITVEQNRPTVEQNRADLFEKIKARQNLQQLDVQKTLPPAKPARSVQQDINSGAPEVQQQNILENIQPDYAPPAPPSSPVPVIDQAFLYSLNQ